MTEGNDHTTPLEALFEKYRRQQDSDALSSIYDRLAPDMLLMASHVLGDLPAAEDAVQASFVAAIEAREQWEATRPLRPWLLGILRNRLRASRRRSGRDVRAAADVGQSDAAASNPVDLLEAEEFTAAVEAAISRTNEPYRRVLELRLHGGYNPRDIARMLDREPAAVRTQLHRGLEMLRHGLKGGFAGTLMLFATAGRGHAAMRAEVIARARIVAKAASMLPFGLSLAQLLGLAAGLVVVAFATLELVQLGGGGSGSGAGLARALDPKQQPTSQAGTAQASTSEPTREPAAASGGGANARAEPALRRWTIHGECHRHSRGEAGEPANTKIAGVRVELHFVEGNANRKVAEVETDEAGRYELDISFAQELTAYTRSMSSFWLRAVKPGFQPSLVDDVRQLPLSPSEELRVERNFELDPGTAIRARIVDERRHPVSVAWGALRIPDLDESIEAEATPDGVFYAGTLVEKRCRAELSIRTNGLGYLSKREITLEPGAVVDCGELVLPAHATLRGRCVYPDGSPARYVTLELTRADEEGDTKTDDGDAIWTEFGQVVSDATGSFVAKGLRPGEYEIKVVGTGGADDPQVVKAETGPDEVRIELRRTRLFLRLVDDAGRTLPRANVACFAWDPPHAGEAAKAYSDGRSLVPLQRQGSYDGIHDAEALGDRVEIFTRPGSFWVFEAELLGMQPYERAFEVPVGQYEIELVFGLRALRHFGELELRLGDEKGFPHVNVAFARGRNDFMNGFVAKRIEGGRYLLRGLAPGRARIKIDVSYPNTTHEVWGKSSAHYYRLPYQGSIVLPENERLVLEPEFPQGGRLELAIVAPELTTGAGAFVTFELRGKESAFEKKLASRWHASEFRLFDAKSRTWAKPGPRWRSGDRLLYLNVLEPGDYELSLQIEGGRRFERTVSIRAGQTTRIRVES